jgi:hypothetical protein
MNQLAVSTTVGTLATGVGPQLRALGVMLAIAAVEILGISNGQRQTTAGGGSKEHLGMTYTARINNFGQVIYQNALTLNIFKLHCTRKLNYKYIKNNR